MLVRVGKGAFAATAASVGVALSFAVITILMDRLPDTVILAAGLAVALLLALGFAGVGSLRSLRDLARSDIVVAIVGGVLAFWAAPLVALTQRATDAPSGAETLFFTTSVWGALVVAASFALASQRRGVTALSGGVAAVVGAAGLLASWEYPSSFSPLAKFPLREAVMVLAGLLFAAGAVALAEATGRMGSRRAIVLGLGAATVAALLAALPSVASLTSAGLSALVPCVYLGAAFALFAAGWIHVAEQVGIARSAAALMAAPLVVTALAGVEGVTSVYGPSPVNWPAAIAAIAVVVSGLVTLWLAEMSGDHAADPSPVGLGPVWVAAAATLLGAASLATPALGALAEGGTADSFHLAWTMIGAESVVGWLVFASAVLALASAVSARVGAPIASWGSSALASLVCLASALPLFDTTLHTWNGWVPAQVQQAYGTEYARFVVSGRFDLTRVAAAVLVVIAVLFIVAEAMRGRVSRNRAGEVV